MLRPIAFVLGLVIAAAGCGGGSPPPDGAVGGGMTGGGMTGGGTGGGSGMTGGETGAGPSIVSLTATPATLVEGGEITISAIVTDPAGLAAVAGGHLTDSADASYGAFSTAGGQGTFSLTLTWAAVQAVTPISYPTGGGTRALTVTFFDNTGGTASLPFALTLGCSSSAEAICDGVCKDLSNDSESCGACGQQVPDPVTEICVDGAPACRGQGWTLCGNTCLATQTDLHHCGGCQTDCAALGFDTCNAGTCTLQVHGTQTAGDTCAAICARDGYGGCYGIGTSLQCNQSNFTCDESISAALGCSEFTASCWCTP